MEPQQPLPEHDPSDWQRFRTNVGAFWEKFGTITLVIVLLISGFIAVRRITAYRAVTAHEKAWSDLATVTSPEVARTVANAHKNPIRAMLYLRGADMLMAELARPRVAEPAAGAPARPEGLGALATPVLSPRDNPEQSLATAKQMYAEVADDAGAHELMRLNARLGLGAVAEAKGDWDQAREIYEQVARAAGTKYEAVAIQATHRSKWLTRMAEPVRFAAEVARPELEVPGMPDMPGSLLDLPTTPAPSTEVMPDLIPDLVPRMEPGTDEVPAASTPEPAPMPSPAVTPVAPAPATETPAAAPAQSGRRMIDATVGEEDVPDTLEE